MTTIKSELPAGLVCYRRTPHFSADNVPQAMLSRPLVYTALTRAQRHLSVVPAVGPALARAVRDVGARPRRTRLRELLSDELQESGG